MKPQIAIVRLTDYGSDVALFMNGEYVISACVGNGESTDTVHEVAASLAGIHGTEVCTIEVNPGEEWQWYTIESQLKASGLLVGGLSEFTLRHTVMDDDGELSQHTMRFQATDYGHAVEQLIDHYRTAGTLLWVNNPDQHDSPALHPVDDCVYQLKPEIGASCVIRVGNAQVHIKEEGEGVVVDIYPSDDDPAEVVASTYALFSECAAGATESES